MMGAHGMGAPMDNDKKKPINRTWQSVRALLMFFGILAVIGFWMSCCGNYDNFRARSYVDDALRVSTPMQLRVEDFYRKRGALPDAKAEADFVVEKTEPAKRVEWIAQERALFVTLAPAWLEDLQLVLVPTPMGDRLEWSCFQAKGRASFVPAKCREGYPRKAS